MSLYERDQLYMKSSKTSIHLLGKSKGVNIHSMCKTNREMVLYFWEEKLK
jgi:hypothetical protein